MGTRRMVHVGIWAYLDGVVQQFHIQISPQSVAEFGKKTMDVRCWPRHRTPYHDGGSYSCATVTVSVVSHSGQRQERNQSKALNRASDNYDQITGTATRGMCTDGDNHQAVATERNRFAVGRDLVLESEKTLGGTSGGSGAVCVKALMPKQQPCQ